MKTKTIGVISIIFVLMCTPSIAVNSFRLLDDYKFAKDNFKWVKKDFYFYLDYKCKEKNIDPLFALAIAQVESGGKNIISKRNKNGTRDFGIFQVNSVWKKDSKDLLNYKTNIDIAIPYLKKCMEKANNNKYIACIYYNAGMNCDISKYKSVYPLKILEIYEKITTELF